MDENQILDNENQGAFALPSQALESLRTAASWSGFLAILGFILIGLMVVFGLFFGAIMGTMMSSFRETTLLPFSAGVFGVIYIVFGLLYFFPVLYLWKFSDKTKAALRSNNTPALNEAFFNLGRHYKYIGIMSIVIIALYLVLFVIGIGSAMMMG